MNPAASMPPSVDFLSGHFTAQNIIKKITCNGDLVGVYQNQQAWQAIPADRPIYQVEMLDSPVQEGELYTGTTHLYPGRVGDEFHMTRGHFHQRREQAEFYFGLRGSGLLLLQDEQGRARLEQFYAGSVHHIPSNTAHRLINTGEEILSALAVWPTVAGHDYCALAEGFSLRVKAAGEGWQVENQHD